MATFTSARTSTLPSSDSKTPRPGTSRRKKDQPRTEIWSNLLRQTREAQARSRTSTLQHRSLILLGGKAEDQRNFIQHYVARPPPPQPSSRVKEKRERGELRLSNRFAYGYGHVTLFSPPQQSGAGSGLLGGEAEEVVRVECHCLPGKPVVGYEDLLSRLLRPNNQKAGVEDDGGIGEEEGGEHNVEDYGRRPSVAVLMSWKEPWTFLSTLQQWLTLLARASLPNDVRKDESPIEVLKETQLNLSVVLQHVDYQETLERENFKDETFDYISQCLRTCLLPFSAALLYTPTAPQPTAPGSSLSEIQKLLYISLSLDVAALQVRRPGSSGAVAQQKKEELLPKHNVVDRMAILVPSGWDSVGKIRLLSETFSPEAVLDGWLADLETSRISFDPPLADHAAVEEATEELDQRDDMNTLQADGTGTVAGAEMYSSAPSPVSPPLSPSKLSKSATAIYEHHIQDPHAHKKPPPPQIEVTTKPEQTFLAEMRAQLQSYEEQDRERAKREPAMTSSTAGALISGNRTSIGGADSGALSELGDVSFNVGGVSYNTVSAEAAIERLKRPTTESSESSPTVGGAPVTPRTVTPRPPKREVREDSVGSGSAKGDFQPDKLEEYFASLMKRGGGGGGSSASSTPSKPPPAQ